MQDYRNIFFKQQKILCTGNPDKIGTIASGVREHFSDCTFIHKSNGYDLANLDVDTTNRLVELFKTHNTFINASFISGFVQSNLLTLCNKSAKIIDVFNIGSTHEYDNLGNELYTRSKLDLRNKSLEYNSYRFKTCHIIVGWIKKNNDPIMENWIDVKEICNIITWVSKQRFNVPIISIDQPKHAW